jgi:glycosyltransferase involved in cell wall biosynthesis
MPNRSRERIGLNLLYLRPGVVGGTETYARGLLTGLARVAPDHEFVVFLNRTARDWHLPAGFERVVCPVSARQGSRYLYEQLALPRLLRRHRIDVVHSLAYVAPVRAPCAGVVTIHDLNYRHPSHRMPAPRRLALRWFVSAAARSCDAVILVSRFVADEVAEVMPHARHKLHVVHEAPIPAPIESGVTLRSDLVPPPYLLAFSSVSANKNLGRLLEAYDRARAEGLRHGLMLVGHRPPWTHASPSGVVWTGYVSDAEVLRCLKGADGLVFPSLYEGFGLPILEAMQAGVAVACSRTASLPEIAGDAAEYFDPADVDSIMRAILRVAGDSTLRANLVRRGFERVSHFSWERAARETLAVYRSAVARRAATR